MGIDGKKTYIVGIAIILYAIGGVVAGKIDPSMAIGEALIALQMMGVRHGIGKYE